MKKYPVSKFYNGIFGLGLLVVLVYETLVIFTLMGDFLDYILLAIGAVGILSGLYIILFDLPTARFSFSDEGITMYVGFKKYETRWS